MQKQKELRQMKDETDEPAEKSPLAHRTSLPEDAKSGASRDSCRRHMGRTLSAAMIGKLQAVKEQQKYKRKTANRQ